MSPRLGIIGGGQLALYLCEAAQALGMHVTVLSDSADDAARHRADEYIAGALDSVPALDALLAGCDVVTFDKEAIPDETLARLIDARSRGLIEIHPDADTLLMLKDKALQKAWLQQHDLATLPFQVLDGNTCSTAALAEKFGGVLVQKSRCGGYDGRGVQVVNVLEPGQQLWDVPSLVEPYLPDRREISIIISRSRAGDIQAYPPVEMDFDPLLNSVRTVTMPAVISGKLAATATALAERSVTLLDGVGVFAIEMFITPAGEVLINEISPRVHNSGHLTLDACNVSQFEQHVRAVAGLPLVAIKQESPAAMLNILYDEAMRGSCPGVPVVEQAVEPGTRVYWYGKTPGSAGRKMGHINSVAPSVNAAVELADRALGKLSAPSGEQAA